MPQNAFAVGIHNERQETESIAQTGCRVLYRNVSDVTDPNLVRTVRNHILHEIGIRWQSVSGVCRTGCTLTAIDVQPMLVQDTTEHVTPDPVLIVETASIHVPQIVGPHLRVLFPDLAHKLHNKLLYRQTAEQDFIVSLVKGLSCNTGQYT